MLVRDYREIEGEPAAEGVTIRWAVAEPEGAQRFALRVIEVQPGAEVALHDHAWEHEIFVVDGSGLALQPDGSGLPVQHGSVAWIPPGEIHGFRNTGEGVLRFVCVIPLPRQ